MALNRWREQWLRLAMHVLRDLSFRYKIPLRGSLLVTITAVLVTASLVYAAYQDSRADLISTSSSLGRLLAKTLVTPLLHDDVWRAYEIINSPFAASAREGDPQTAEFVIVLDRRNHVYVTTHPSDYPLLSDLSRINPQFLRLQQQIARYKEFESTAVDMADSDRIYMVTPVVSDGVLLGTLIMAYSKSAFLPRFYNLARNGALVMLLVCALVLPGSWYWAQRFAKPLVDLADAMGRVGTRIPEDDEIAVQESRDEIGRLATAFRTMLRQLREKQSLEKEVILSERLAAIGRLSAAIAHEINNPLGGMLNAISTFRRHGTRDPLGERTLSLIERGLLQVKDTVSALLVEARYQSHPLSRQDVEDTHTLVLADAREKRAKFVWENRLHGMVALPSTLVRQILINLLLNASQAVKADGRLSCLVEMTDATLCITVINDGDFIPQETMEYLFEPFATQRETGHGLGLWVTYQIVRQLGGEIAAESAPGETRFTVTLPIPKETT